MQPSVSVSPAVPDAALRPPPLFRHVEPSVMDSGVTIVGIVVCAVVVVVAVVFVVVQRVYWRRIPKYSVANNEESPAHVVHSSSAQSSQPSSPGPQVQVDMDIPLTGECWRLLIHGRDFSGYSPISVFKYVSEANIKWL